MMLSLAGIAHHVPFVFTGQVVCTVRAVWLEIATPSAF